jgi:hypothetical protein
MDMRRVKRLPSIRKSAFTTDAVREVVRVCVHVQPANVIPRDFLVNTRLVKGRFAKLHGPPATA